MFLFFLVLCLCAESYVPDIKSKNEILHKLTSFTTYYGLFGVSEKASLSEINKSFRRLNKAEPPSNLNASQYKELIMNGYNILNNFRKAYDDFLMDSRFYYIDDPVNYKNYFAVTLLAITFGFFVLDFIVYAVRYLRYIENTNSAKKDKNTSEKPKKKDKKALLSAPEMYSMRIFSSIVRKIGRN